MQTKGLFSSPGKNRSDSSLMGTLGAALVLVFGVVLISGLSLDRTQNAMVRFLAEKGVALASALESGIRSGTRSRGGIRLQFLVEELAARPDVRFIAVTMPDGTILAHSNPQRVGEVLSTSEGRELTAANLEAMQPADKPAWTIMDMEGSRSFVVFKTFRPQIRETGKHHARRMHSSASSGPIPYIFLGLDLTPLEVAQAQNQERAGHARGVGSAGRHAGTARAACDGAHPLLPQGATGSRGAGRGAGGDSAGRTRPAGSARESDPAEQRRLCIFLAI